MTRQTRIEGLGRWLQTLESDVSEEDELISTPYDPVVWGADEVKDITLRLTEPEFVRLLSALSVGSTITYPENPFAVYWSFLRNYEYPIPMTTCDVVLDCILNNEAVRAAIGGAGSGPGFEASLRERGLGKFDDALSFAGPGGCENDNLFGTVSQMLSALNNNNIDFFESVEVGTNLVEFMSAVGQITGADEASIVDFVSTFVEFTQENFAENYAASYTDELYDEMRCDIFCIAKDNCELTLDTFWDYFSAKMSSFNLQSIGISDILQSFVLGEFTSNVTVYAFMWLQLATVRGVDSFIANLTRGTVAFGAAQRLLLQMISFSNDPDPDWVTLCDDCASVPGFVVFGELGSTTVTRVGNTYTITRGFIGSGGAGYLYVQASSDGAPSPDISLAYSALQYSGAITNYDWSDTNGSYNSAPPTGIYSVGRAGILSLGANLNTLQFVLTTNLPYQGVVQGS